MKDTSHEIEEFFSQYLKVIGCFNAVPCILIFLITILPVFIICVSFCLWKVIFNSWN